jgi:hypothetical protein
VGARQFSYFSALNGLCSTGVVELCLHFNLGFDLFVWGDFKTSDAGRGSPTRFDRERVSSTGGNLTDVFVGFGIVFRGRSLSPRFGGAVP